jgi:hypothetical protein
MRCRYIWIRTRAPGIRAGMYRPASGIYTDYGLRMMHAWWCVIFAAQLSSTSKSLNLVGPHITHHPRPPSTAHCRSSARIPRTNLPQAPPWRGRHTPDSLASTTPPPRYAPEVSQRQPEAAAVHLCVVEIGALESRLHADLQPSDVGDAGRARISWRLGRCVVIRGPSFTLPSAFTMAATTQHKAWARPGLGDRNLRRVRFDCAPFACWS